MDTLADGFAILCGLAICVVGIPVLALVDKIRGSRVPTLAAEDYQERCERCR